MGRVNLVVWDNAAGFTRDANIVESLLVADGHLVERHHLAPPGLAPRLAHLVRRRRPRYDVNIFFQNVIREWMPMARRNVLLPNPEHFGESGLPLLADLDAILCKTRSAVDTFARFNHRTHFVGFTSMDRRDSRAAESAPADRTGFLHVAGQSSQKGTRQVLDVWCEHPEWPHLTLIAREASGVQKPSALPPNITFHDAFLDDATVRYLQNTKRVHLCPSEVEGFGHTLMEALSCSALVITVDAPPMNELVTSDEGVYTGWTDSRSMHLATRYEVDRAQLEQAIERALAMPDHELARRRAAARRRFDMIDRDFRETFPRTVGALM